MYYTQCAIIRLLPDSMRQHAILFYTCTPPRGNNDRLQNQSLTHTRKKTETGDSVYFLALQIPIMLTPMRSGIALASPVVGSQTSPKPWRFQDALFLPTPHTHTHTPQDIGQQILPTMPKQARHPFPGTERISSQRGTKLTQAFPAMGQDIYATQT